MSFSGNGTFVINSAGQPVVANTVISATVFNALTADLATGLSTCITKDGQTTPTANIPMGSNKITTLAAGTAATDAANLGQVQSTAAKLITVSGTDTVTGTMSPALTAYAAGQLFYFVAAGTNTTAMTINIDGLGAKAITRDGSTALAAGDVISGEIVVICYDGTRFQMINAANSFGNATITGSLTLSGGTANGVLYLNGSKVATSGSALYFNGTQFGVGATSINAANTAEVTGDINTTWAASANRFVGMRFTDGSGYEIGMRAIESTRELRLLTKAADGTGLISFYTGITPTERMRLTDTTLYTASGINVGIGTSSPDGPLQVSFANAETSQFNAGAAVAYLTNTNTTNNNWAQIFWTDSDGGAVAAAFGAQYTDHTNDYAALSFSTRGASGLGERARITSGGKWLVNTTSTAFPGIELVQQATSADECASFWNSATSGDNNIIKFYTDGGSGRGNISYNRAGGLIAYNTTSDYRAKDILGPVADPGATIDALKVYEGQMKGATQSRPMLIAHEAQEIAPYAVTGKKDAVNDDGDPIYQQMDHSSLVPLLIAEVKSLRARVAALESK